VESQHVHARLRQPGSLEDDVIEHEGTQVCGYLNTLGVTAVLLKYWAPARDPKQPSRELLQDAQRAIGLVRRHAAEWGPASALAEPVAPRRNVPKRIPAKKKTIWC
jgi:hypothetical protein